MSLGKPPAMRERLMEVNLVINGKEYAFSLELTGADLLRELQITPSTVVVELNGQIVKREEFLERLIKEGDSLELVTIVGGG